ncbi:hypothetical protein J4H86_25495 [Spiractinospora alimapuensis]|uniref:baeRF10 domain-containing protein n=1 Tax=Spiractinospora alimapuensis TaxID=2820884 RepID=UPI001F1D5188|nr:hypothetical protein [Spiractinospora alimapuensis]QVQ52043.1 hypothetical protein J4H86_25495 [Spiractinospora alimapuensis]
MQSRNAPTDMTLAGSDPRLATPEPDDDTMPGHTTRQARSLLRVHATNPGVVTVCLTTPRDPAELRGIPARVRALLATVSDGTADRDPTLTATLNAIGETLGRAEGKPLGRGRAVVAAPEIDLFEEVHLPQEVPDSAMLGPHPYVRPLISAIQRSPVYYVAVADRRFAWLFQADAARIREITWITGDQERSRNFAGWDGLEEYRVRRSADERLQRHHRDTAAILEQALRQRESELLVVGGHSEAVSAFVAELDGVAADRLAGTFVIDPHTMTSARVHEHASTVLRDWCARRQRTTLDRIRDDSARAVWGLSDTVGAANQRSVEILCIPEEGTVPGYTCDECGGLSDVRAICPMCQRPARHVDDLYDELAYSVLRSGGEVVAIDPEIADPAEHELPLALNRFG